MEVALNVNGYDGADLLEALDIIHIVTTRFYFRSWSISFSMIFAPSENPINDLTIIPL